jgi:hypothetical protein
MQWMLFKENGEFHNFAYLRKKRFGEIKRDIADISPKMLSQELKHWKQKNYKTDTLRHNASNNRIFTYSAGFINE